GVLVVVVGQSQFIAPSSLLPSSNERERKLRAWVE
uniref:Uncharacterized protein n=1 Tax=Caenorhabditis japonica TaxID=281687 RepID=A0A8R1ESS6_CAEJA